MYHQLINKVYRFYNKYVMNLYIFIFKINILIIVYYSLFKSGLKNIACYSLNDYIINIKACRVNYRQKNTQRLG